MTKNSPRSGPSAASNMLRPSLHSRASGGWSVRWPVFANCWVSGGWYAVRSRASARLAASSRSALLRAAADFVALRGFDDLYALGRLQEQNGALASVAFQRKMPRHAAFAGNDVWG